MLDFLNEGTHIVCTFSSFVAFALFLTIIIETSIGGYAGFVLVCLNVWNRGFRIQKGLKYATVYVLAKSSVCNQ